MSGGGLVLSMDVVLGQDRVDFGRGRCVWGCSACYELVVFAAVVVVQVVAVEGFVHFGVAVPRFGVGLLVFRVGLVFVGLGHLS
ncbi:hypothetical protein BDR26DRAFT_618085 [Obelidium mucronatum]|nr:hypothetical protein BDR26DRAFT_618085 [Obelidium mucronatum]